MIGGKGVVGPWVFIVVVLLINHTSSGFSAYCGLGCGHLFSLRRFFFTAARVERGGEAQQVLVIEPFRNFLGWARRCAFARGPRRVVAMRPTEVHVALRAHCEKFAPAFGYLAYLGYLLGLCGI
jgi:hypothetical protein